MDERKMVEPEILPPERGDPAARRGPAGGRERVRVVFGGGDFRSLRFVRPSPLGILVVGLVLGALAVALLVFLLGAVLISLPVIGVLVVAALLTGLLRGRAGRPR